LGGTLRAAASRFPAREGKMPAEKAGFDGKSPEKLLQSLKNRAILTA
jgi:hypothetical protein